MSFLQELINSKVVSSTTNDEDALIEFSNGSRLNVFNRYSITPVSSELIGSMLTSVVEHQNEIILMFDNFIALEIGLEDDDYNGPEALGYIDSSGRIVIWS